MTMTMDNHTAIRTHNRSGIASFIIGATSVALVVGAIVTAGVMTSNGTMTPEFSMMLGLALFGACFVDLIGIGLGIFGAADRSSKKVYPVLGLVLNGLFLASFAALAAIGIAMQSA
jgi:hypothetical protein